jgi:hypothetical protein
MEFNLKPRQLPALEFSDWIAAVYGASRQHIGSP